VRVTERNRRTIGWIAAAFGSSVMIRSSCRRSVKRSVAQVARYLSGKIMAVRSIM